MRAFSLAALVVVGCAEDTSAEHEFHELAARTTVECGLYDYNYPPDVPHPPYLCGPQPNIGCINDAIGKPSVAHMTRSYVDAQGGELMNGTALADLAREHHYFAANGKLVWIAYYELGLDDPGWYRRDCTGLEVTPYDLDGMTCWKFVHSNCVWRK
jgi:hypothetical protein